MGGAYDAEAPVSTMLCNLIWGMGGWCYLVLFYRCTWAICIVFLFIFMACMISLSKFQLLGGGWGVFFGLLYGCSSLGLTPFPNWS